MENQKHNPKEIWWKPAVEIFSAVSSWIVVPLVSALILGKYLDKKWGTEPWIFIALAALGFMTTCVGIYKVMKRYSDKLKNINDGDK